MSCGTSSSRPGAATTRAGASGGRSLGTGRRWRPAPPGREDCAPFVKVAGLMAQAGLNVPRILDWEQSDGFMLLDDLGHQTMMDVIEREDPPANQGLYLRAVDALVATVR